VTAVARPSSDRLFALTVFGMVLFGIVMIYSASIIVGHTTFGDDKFFVRRQIIWAVIGFIGMAVASTIPYQVWRKWAGVMFGTTFLLLISVLLFSRGEINGAHRWIEVGGMSFQP
jgi:cell division protein FtsW